MRIALISCEFAGLVSRGGIGTYMRNLADMLAARGHEVEVFAAGDETSSHLRADGVWIHVVHAAERGEFPEKIVPIFMERHRQDAFDVAEGAEFLAETRGVSAAAPDLPLVLKLHTPSSMIENIEMGFVPIRNKVRFLAGGFARGQLPKPYWTYRRGADYELVNLSAASEVTSPSRAMVDALKDFWGLDGQSVQIIPNVFLPPASLLGISPQSRTNVISFIGRLELRKGVLDLADALPEVLDRFPETRFHFIGRPLRHPADGRDIGDILRDKLDGYWSQIKIVPGLPYDQALDYYSATDICVFPSIWENFPNVCLEAMSAARGVIGSSAGGMSEMIDPMRTGLLVPPRSPKAIASSMIELLKDPERRMKMGEAARDHVLTRYSADVIGPLQEASYKRAIERAKDRICAKGISQASG